MALTKTTDLTNSVVTQYEKSYYLIGADHPGTWAQFVDWQPAIPENGGGFSALDFPVYTLETDPVETALTEDADVTPETMPADSNVTVTPYEYGKTWGITKKLMYQVRTNYGAYMGKVTAWNRINSIDRILRRAAVGRGTSLPTFRVQLDGTATMSNLTASHYITRDFIEQIADTARSMDIEPFQGGGYRAIVHPSLMYDIRQISEYESIATYQDAGMIYGAADKPVTMAGVTFIPSKAGKVYLSAGTVTQAATTLSSAAAKGATTIAVAEGTGLSAGNFITIGTIESETVNPGSNQEQVYIVSSTASSGAATLTIRGKGETGFGLRFDHASAEAVTEGPNVAAIPIIGKNSLIGVYGSDSGRYGIPKAKIGGLDYLDRFSYYGWYWYGGVAVLQRNILLAKCAMSRGVYGYN